MYGFGNTLNNHLQLDRPILSRQHQIIGWLCNDTRQLVDYALFDFNRSTLVSVSVLPRDSFESQVSQIITQFIEQVPLNYRRFVLFMTEMLHGNLLPSLDNSDWLLKFGNASNDYLLRAIPRIFENSTCTCAVSSMCNRSMQIGPPDLIIPGLVVGCSPVDGLRMSTLECFFSSSCIATILAYLDYFTQMDGSPPIDFVSPIDPPLVITALNESKLSRFLTTTRIGSIVDELFVEKWEQASYYEKYFSACAPRSCHYEYVRRNDFLYLLTSLLGVYGGLTASLHFLTWNGLRLFEKVKNRICNRGNFVQPFGEAYGTERNDH